MPNLGAGIFEQKVGAILSACALNTVLPDIPGKSSKVTIELELKQIGTSSQVIMFHTIKSKMPTRNGDSAETDKTETPLFVGYGGHLSIEPTTGVMGQQEIDAAFFQTSDQGK